MPRVVQHSSLAGMENADSSSTLGFWKMEKSLLALVRSEEQKCHSWGVCCKKCLSVQGSTYRVWIFSKINWDKSMTYYFCLLQAA